MKRVYYNFIGYEELFEAIDNDSTENKFNTIGKLLISAINDWPLTNLQEPKELIKELNIEVKGKLTYNNLEAYLKKLSANNNAWKMEAISSVLKIYWSYNNKIESNSTELEKIIEELSVHYMNE